MVEAHVVDAWTRDSDRQDFAYLVAVFVAGLGAPLFLFLAGVAVPMAASKRSASIGHRAAGAAARLRGWQVFALAFVFRLQSQLLGWGPLVNFLKVDILNVMGLALAVAGMLWGLSMSRTTRIVLFAAITVAFTMSTPLIREASWLAWLPDPIEWYVRPAPRHTTFVLFPWAGFLFAGAAIGELIDAQRSKDRDARLHVGLACGGVLAVAGGYLASLQPSIYPIAEFWTSSPTFFCIRLGIAITMVPLAWILEKAIKALSFLDTLGRSSLFVYWIHVEMVYGVIGIPLRHLLPLWGSILATLSLCGVLLALVRWKNRLSRGFELTGPFRILAPVLR